MYILDTNVVSELRKAGSARADANVVGWASRIPPAALFLSVITVLELELGVRLSERRDPAQGAMLRTWLDEHVLPAFVRRTLPVDTAVARCCAALHVPMRHGERDALIAATALIHGMILVTHNIADFTTTGVRMLNPWEPPRSIRTVDM